MNEDFTDIEFHHGLPSHSFVDKKNEVRISLGRAATVPKAYAELQGRFGNILLGIQSCGMDQARLDQMCNLLRLNCETLRIDLLVTKSNRPFDSQWYYFGDIDGLLKAARSELVRPPFGTILHDQISSAINMLIRKPAP
ncbi:MAG: hypothetical protein KKA05_04165 [Alphaproteobacteria bacterium]|nr:hypothetical protein [Alphaproteobacteria bacterium]MBU0859712.1 hypothetical protein [Alphaproteobacteria bacterium]